MSKIYSFIKTILGFGLIAGIAIANASDKKTNVIIFGDSLSDVGNNQWVEVSGRLGAPFTNQDKQTGNRLIWVNELVAHFQADKEVSPSSNIAITKLNASFNNISYAWGSAETGNHYINDEIKSAPYATYNDEACQKFGSGQIGVENACIPGVQLQVAQYLKDVQYHPNPHSIFILWAGGNDLFNNFMKLYTSGRDLQSLIIESLSVTNNHLPETSDLSYPIANLLKAKNDLVDAGISPNQIYVIDLADLSTLPAMKKLVKINPAIPEFMHMLTIVFNGNLISAMTNTDAKYDLPESHIYFSTQLMDEVIKDPAAMGFTNVKDSCVDNAAEPVCEGYLFYDDKHPTVATGKILGKKFSEYLAGQN